MDVRFPSALNMPPPLGPCHSTALVCSYGLLSPPVLRAFAAIDELYKTGQFSEMDLRSDEEEHSIEMHLPYVRKIFEGYVTLVLASGAHEPPINPTPSPRSGKKSPSSRS